MMTSKNVGVVGVAILMNIMYMFITCCVSTVWRDLCICVMKYITYTNLYHIIYAHAHVAGTHIHTYIHTHAHTNIHMHKYASIYIIDVHTYIHT